MVRDPCWECIKGRHLNCTGQGDEPSDPPCDCPHPDGPLEWHPTDRVYAADTPPVDRRLTP